MIVEGLLNLIAWLLGLLLTPVNIPSLPEGVATAISRMSGYIADGLGIFAAFTHYQFLISLLAIVLVIDAAILLWKFVMWVIRKIPMGGMS